MFLHFPQYEICSIKNTLQLEISALHIFPLTYCARAVFVGTG
jgi:hypothetical protein